MYNKTNTVILANYSQYVDGKDRNGGCYGSDEIYTWNPETGYYVYEWFTTCELVPNSEPVKNIPLQEVLHDIADFIRNHADVPDCTVYVNGIAVWESNSVDVESYDDNNIVGFYDED